MGSAECDQSFTRGSWLRSDAICYNFAPSARSSVGLEYLATNQGVVGSNPAGRAIFQRVTSRKTRSFLCLRDPFIHWSSPAFAPRSTVRVFAVQDTSLSSRLTESVVRHCELRFLGV